jgi:hypothetical protein
MVVLIAFFLIQPVVSAQDADIDGDSYVSLKFKPSAVSAPKQLSADAWTYLQRLTWEQEAPIPFLYNDGDKMGKDGRGNVTYGIGILLEPRTAITQEVADRFHNRKTRKAASIVDLQNDYDFAAKTPRGDGGVNPYAKGTLCRIPQDKMTDLMANTLKLKLAALLSVKYPNDQPLSSNFDKYPAQAKVCMISYAYGMIPTAVPGQKNSAPKLLTALQNLDFAAAADEVHLKNISERKNRAHKALLQNAAQIAKGGVRDSLPDSVDPQPK